MTPPTTGPQPLDRLRPAGWAGLAVGAAFAASALTGALANSSVLILVGTSITRSGMDVAGVGCVGLALLALILPAARRLPGSAQRDLERVRAVADRALVALAGAWLMLVVLAILFRTADAYGESLGQLSGSEFGRFVTQLAGGRGLVLTIVCVAAVLYSAVLRLRDRARVQARIPLALSVLGLITPSITGHAGLSPFHQLSILAIGVHVVGAAVWVGGLACVLILVARHRVLLEAVLPRYSRLAGWCLAAVTLSGVVTAAIRLGTWDELVGSAYGTLVLAKTAGLILVAALGALTRRRLMAGRTPVLRWAGVEIAVMTVTLGIAAALSQSA